MVELVKKGGEVGLMGAACRNNTAARDSTRFPHVLTEKLSIYGGFAVTHGAHAGIGTLPIVYFGTEVSEEKVFAEARDRRVIGAYCLSEPQAGSGRAELLDARRTQRGRHALHPQRTRRCGSPRRLRRYLHRVCEN